MQQSEYKEHTGNDTIEQFEAFYEQYYPYAWRIARGYGLDPPEAEDICQDVFCTFWQVRKRIVLSDPEKARAFVEISARHRVLDLLKSQKKKREKACADPLYECTVCTEKRTSVEDVVIRKEHRECARLVLYMLRQKNRRAYDILIKSSVLGIPVQEIAREYDISPTAVTSLVCRSRKWIRKRLLLLYTEKELSGTSGGRKKRRS